jgi:CheY-like chemotaxis protein
MRKIMVVEDDNTMQSLLGTLLQMEGYEVIFGGDSLGEIMDTIAHGQPDILLVDVKLKKCSGLEITQKIRQNTGEYNPFILMTSGREMSEQCYAAGADGFLLKPYMPNELTDWLKDKIEQKRG